MRTSLSACWLLLAILGLPLVAQGQDADSGVVATPAVHFAMGLPEDSPEDIAGAGEAEAPARGNVPSSIDLSTSFPAPSTQGTMGTCAGWAVANLASFHENEERRRVASGVGPNFSPLYPYNLSKRSADNDCSMGISVAQALRVLQDQGIAPVASYPYSTAMCGVAPTEGVHQAARPYRIASWAKVNERDANVLKSFLAARQPLVIDIRVDDAFQQAGAEKYSQRSGNQRGFHALVLVGYDDEKHAWKVLNSWGSDWGDRGYGWIDYDVWNDIVRAAYVTEDLTTPPTPASLDEFVRPAPPAVEEAIEEHVIDRSTLDSDLRLGMTSAEFSSATHEYGTGVELEVVAPYTDASGGTRFNATWRRGARSQGWSWHYTARDLTELFQRQRRTGDRVSRLWVTGTGNDLRYHMSWVRGGPDRNATWNFSAENISAHYDAQVAHGWAIDALIATPHPAGQRLHAVWRDGTSAPSSVPGWFDRADTFARTAGIRREAGYQLVGLSPVIENNRVYFHSVFFRQTAPTTWSIFDNSTSFGATSDRLRALGFSPSVIEVTVEHDTPSFHSVWTRRSGCAWGWNHSARSLTEQHTQYVREHLVMTWLRSYAIGAQQRFVAVWCRSN